MEQRNPAGLDEMRKALLELRRLPPLVEGYADGKVKWQRFGEVDFDAMGYLLSCHLIVEHYLDHFLATLTDAPLDWPAARLQFSQKVALISRLKFEAPYDLLPSIRHLNVLRNRLAHRVAVKIVVEDLEPLVKAIPSSGRSGPLASPVDVLARYTTVCLRLVRGRHIGPDAISPCRIRFAAGAQAFENDPVEAWSPSVGSTLSKRTESHPRCPSLAYPRASLQPAPWPPESSSWDYLRSERW